MRLLAIDSSNQTLTIAVCEDEEILGQYTLNIKKNHSLTLMPLISNLMENVGMKPEEIDRIVVAKGPGSYTGLRIGVTTAKTIAYSLKKELVGISSLQTLAANCINIEGPIIPLFDARRNNVYTGCYEFRDGKWINLIADQHIALEQWLDQLKKYSSLYFVGEDVDKFWSQIVSILPNAKRNNVSQWQIPSANVLADLGRNQTKLEDIHSFLPAYLKRVEAEENWLKNHKNEENNYVEKI